MVLSQNFQDIFEVCSKYHSLSLPSVKENSFIIRYEDSNFQEVYPVFSGFLPPLPFAESEVFDAYINHSRRLTTTAEACKPVYEVTFDITDSNFNFNPGDTIGVVPHNSDDDINFIINHLNLTTQADLVYNLSCNKNGAKIPPFVPVRSTLRHVLQNYLDLRTIVKKVFLLALSKHTKNENERRVLEYLCSKEGSHAYNTHILNKKICILDIFTIFKSCVPTVEVLLANLPRLLPRPYSIVNSKRYNRNMMKICFSVMNLENKRKGLTTDWLEKLIMKENDIESRLENLSIKESIKEKIPIYLRKNMSGFSMPSDAQTPLILIGPGTGVSPFIGFLEERQYLKENFDLNFGDIWLFFGCRNPKLDFIYEKELKEFLLNGSLSKLTTSFSRIEGEVKYVQDAILQNGEEIINYINNGAAIFICGDVKNMATQVKQTLIQCLVKYDGKTEEEAEKLLSVMQTGKRYFVDVWN